MTVDPKLVSALDEIIRGGSVERSVHKLRYGEDDVTAVFIERLAAHGYKPCRVGDIDIGFDERVPAFVIRGDTAYFGWVFVERFTEIRSRKLFGSRVRNGKGDWAIQIGHKSVELIYANPSAKSGMEFESTFDLE